eukprot:COSAG01_NODE_33729_length_559_cov_3.089130_1_plen_102_part_01
MRTRRPIISHVLYSYKVRTPTIRAPTPSPLSLAFSPLTAVMVPSLLMCIPKATGGGHLVTIASDTCSVGGGVCDTSDRVGVWAVAAAASLDRIVGGTIVGGA